MAYAYDKASRRTVLAWTGGSGADLAGWGDQTWGSSPYGGTATGWGLDQWGSSQYGGESGGGGTTLLVDYYAYDAASRLTTLQATGNGTNAAAYYEYDPSSNCTQKIVANGLVTTYYAFDPANRISSIVHRKADTTLLASLGYTYDPAGRIVRIDREAGLHLYYSYDDANRLTGEHWVNAGNATVYAFTWDYDPVSNRTLQLANWGLPNGSATYYDYNAANELTHLHVVGGDFGGIQPGHSYFEYDATGNMTLQLEPDGATYFTYTPFNLMESIHHKDDTWTRCWYDGQLRRYALEDPTNGLRYFTWDQNGLNLLTEQSPDGTLVRRYTHGYTPIKGIGSLTRAENPTTGDTASPFMDHRGTVLGVVDEGGSVTDYAYNAWGYGFGSLDGGSSVTSRWRYQTNWAQGIFQISISPTRLYFQSIGRFMGGDILAHGNVNALVSFARNIPFWSNVSKSNLAIALLDRIGILIVAQPLRMDATGGFTLIEILIVVAIVAILASVITWLINKGRKSGAIGTFPTHDPTAADNSIKYFNKTLPYGDYQSFPPGNAIELFCPGETGSVGELKFLVFHIDNSDESDAGTQTSFEHDLQVGINDSLGTNEITNIVSLGSHIYKSSKNSSLGNSALLQMGEFLTEDLTTNIMSGKAAYRGAGWAAKASQTDNGPRSQCKGHFEWRSNKSDVPFSKEITTNDDQYAPFIESFIDIPQARLIGLQLETTLYFVRASDKEKFPVAKVIWYTKIESNGTLRLTVCVSRVVAGSPAEKIEWEPIPEPHKE